MGFSVREHTREQRPEDFDVTLSNTDEKAYLADPKRLHYTRVAELDSLPPMQQIEALLLSGAEAFRADPEMDGEMIEAVMLAWREHYGVGEQGEA